MAKGQLNLFEEKKPTKIESFQKVLREKICNGEIKNNQEALEFTFSQGHISTHADEEIRRMKKEGIITYDSRSPMVTYEKVFKDRKIISFKLV